MIKTETVDYQEGETTLEGHFVWDDDVKGARPGLLVVPEWYGISEFTLECCRAPATMGYLAFAVDVYGKGIRPAEYEAAQRESKTYYDDRALLRRRGYNFSPRCRRHPVPSGRAFSCSTAPMTRSCRIRKSLIS